MSISKVLVMRKVLLEQNTEIKQQLTEPDNDLACSNLSDNEMWVLGRELVWQNDECH